MANFDNNYWYQMVLKSSSTLSFASSTVTKGSGSAFFQVTNTTRPSQKWQVYGTANNTYVFRSSLGGPTGYLTAHGNPVDKSTVNSGNTVPTVSDYTIADNSMYWSIKPWGDGSFWMENQANGSAWHLEKETTGLMTMSSNITKPQTGQSFEFKQLDQINDAKYSTLKVRRPFSFPFSTFSLF
jgi:streptogramin lyase